MLSSNNNTANTTTPIATSSEEDKFQEAMEKINMLKDKIKKATEYKFHIDGMKVKPGNADEDEAQYQTKQGTKYENANQELEVVKDFFGKLKFNFLELETKERFLKKVLDEDFIATVLDGKPSKKQLVLDPVEMKKLEDSVEEKKKDLQEFKNDINILKENLSSLITKVADLRPLFDEKVEEMKDQANDLEFLTSELRELRQNELLTKFRTAAECEKVLAQQTETMKQLLDDIEQEKINLRSLELKSNATREKNEKLRREYDDIMGRVNEVKQKVDEQDPREVEMQRDLEEMSNHLQKITGITVTLYEMGKILKFKVRPVSQPEQDSCIEYPVTIEFGASHGKIASIQVDESPSTDNSNSSNSNFVQIYPFQSRWLNDLISYSNEEIRQPLSFFVTEISQLLETHYLRQVELIPHLASYDISLPTGDPDLIEFKSLTTQISFRIKVDSDYPVDPDSHVYLADVLKSSQFKGQRPNHYALEKSNFESLIKEHQPSTISDMLMICESI